MYVAVIFFIGANMQIGKRINVCDTQTLEAVRFLALRNYKFLFFLFLKRNLNACCCFSLFFSILNYHVIT